MIPIICNNDLQDLLDKLQEYLQKNGKIGGMRLVDHTEQQIVILISEKPISAEIAEIWFEGYQNGLKAAL
jgi:hypothetical protein